ncbi:MAG: DUF5938 domain-containing protein, partial [Proteobacteria bacterium]|nr:DUF5938 domain-containing protein [Pseudomonadota bacterium]
AGRNQKRLEEEMAKVPELKGHDYKCVAVAHERKAFAGLFAGKQVVINVTGPFMQLGRPVVEACLDAGCHYFDTTGETDWMALLKKEFGKKFAAKKLALVPANSYMWAEGNLAVEVALETPGIDTLELVYFADSQVSVASTLSFMRMCTKPQYFKQNNQMVEWPMATAYPVNVPGEHQPFLSLPWSGGGEPLWYEDDKRVSNIKVLVAFRNQEAMKAILGILQKFEVEARHLSYEEQEVWTNTWGAAITQVEPPRENPDVNRSVLSCYARGNTNSLSVILRGNSPYIQTGVIAAEAARRALLGQLKAVGFCSPTALVGARNLMGVLVEEGYLAWDAKTV